MFKTPLRISPASRRLLVVAALILASLTACGGPLSHTVKLSEVPREKRSSVASGKEAADDAKAIYDSSRSTFDSSAKEIKKSEDDLKRKKGDLDIASEALDLEKAKEGADRSADVRGARTRLEQAKKALKIAKAKLKLDEEKRTHRKNLMKLAEAEWHLALAEYEKSKLDEITSEDPKHAERAAKISEQLAEKQRAQEKAHERSDRSASDVEKADGRLADARDK